MSATASNRENGAAEAVEQLIPPSRRRHNSGATPMTAPSRVPSRFSLVLADVDGTLVTPRKTLTSRTIASVTALHDAGIAFAITSGRPPRGMAMLIEPLALRTPIAGFNGGVFTHPDLSLIKARDLDPAAARKSIDLLLDVADP